MEPNEESAEHIVTLILLYSISVLSVEYRGYQVTG